MAIYSSGLWWVAAALLLAVPYTNCGEMKRPDVTSRISQIILLSRTLEDKLERHEQRERLLGEHIRKQLTNLDKHQQEIKGTVSRLDERLANVETNIMQMDDQEKRIQRILEELKPLFKASTEFNNKMNNELQRRYDTTDAKLEALSREIRTLTNSVSPDSLRVLCPEVTTDTRPFEKAISDSEELLNKFEQKLSEYNTTAATATQAGSALLSEVAAADEAAHNNMTEAIERQEKQITKIQKLLSDAESMWKDLPRLSDLKLATNQTLVAIDNATGNIVANDNTLASGVQSKVRELSEKLEATDATIQQTLAQTVKDLLEALATINTQILNLPSSSTVQAISDNVLFIKKRLENSLIQLRAIYAEVKTGNQKSEKLQREIANNIARTLDKHYVHLEGISSVVNVMYPQLSADHYMLTNITSTSQNCSENSSTIANKLENAVTGIKKELEDLEQMIKNEATKLKVEINSNSVPARPGPRPPNSI